MCGGGGGYGGEEVGGSVSMQGFEGCVEDDI